MKAFLWLVFLVGWICLGPPDCAAVVITRGPYLQLATPNSVVIRWRTDVATNSVVDFGLELGDLTQHHTNLPATTEHVVGLTNLAPNTRYYYTVGTSWERLTPVTAAQYFLTHPPFGSPHPLRVWVIGDAGVQTTNQIAVRDAFEAYNGNALVHAWLQLGDNAYQNGTDAEYQAAFFNIYSNRLRRTATWPTLGNHDTALATNFVNSYPYFDMFTLPKSAEAGGVPSGTEHYYSFELGLAHFICLDSMTANRATNGPMATWLRADLAANTNQWLIAYWHHAPYSKGSHDSDAELEMRQMREHFLPLLEAGGVDVVLTGHSHAYERTKFLDGHYGSAATFHSGQVVQPGLGRTNEGGVYHKADNPGSNPLGHRGTVYVVAGSSGSVVSGPFNHPAMLPSLPQLGSLVLDFTTNTLHAVFLRQDGIIADAFTIRKDNQAPPRLVSPALRPDHRLQFTVLTRALSTNIIEASPTPSGGWTAVQTNVSVLPSFIFTNPAPATNQTQFFRARKS